MTVGEGLGFCELTEIGGEEGSRAQVRRAHNRYRFAESFCRGGPILEVGCGAGQGLGLLGRRSSLVCGVDVDRSNLAHARVTYAGRSNVFLQRADAGALPFRAGGFELVVCFEALYYFTDPVAFVRESKRVLSGGGKLILCTVNKDLFDFHPSPRAVRYHGVAELNDLLSREGFSTTCFGEEIVDETSFPGRGLRRLKQVAVRFGLIPRTLGGRRLLKRLFYGRLVELPREIGVEDVNGTRPTPVSATEPDRRHRILYAVGQLP